MFDRIKIKRMYHLDKQKKIVIRLAILMSIQTAFLYLYYPFIAKRIIDVEIPNHNYRNIIFFSIILILCVLIRFISTVFTEITRKKHYYYLESELKKQIFENVQYSEISDLEKNQVGNLIEIATGQCAEASKLFVWNILGAFSVRLLQVIIICIVLILLNLKIGLLVVLIILFSYLCTMPIFKKTKKITSKIQEIFINLQGKTNEFVDSFSTTKTLRLEEVNLEDIKKTLEECKKEVIKSNKMVTIHNIIFTALSFFAVLAVIIVGGLDLSTGVIGASIIFLSIDYIDSLKRNTDSFLEHINGMISRYNCFENVLSLIDIKKENQEGNIILENINDIEFSNVHMTYDNKNMILNGISFKANRPMKIAVVGKSGSGKTTLVNLIPKFYKIFSGKILINNIDISKIDTASLRDNIAYVFQEPSIFEMSIEDNIKFGLSSEIALKEIMDVCKVIGIHDKINEFPNKYATIISSKSDYLSYGEKQLICFARAILKKADLVILDEVTSNIDLSYEDKINEATEQLLKNKISFVIAHRLNTIRKADLILFIEDGKIVEMGTHKQLLVKKGAYYSLFNN